MKSIIVFSSIEIMVREYGIGFVAIIVVVCQKFSLTLPAPIPTLT